MGSDTMVLDKLDDLWNIDLQDHPIAGVDDCMGKVALVKTQHLKPDAIHCNAGMYLIDLSIWREENWTEQFHHYIKGLFDKHIALGGYEEEVITKVVGERMMVLPPKYNLMTLEQVFTYKELIRFRQPLRYYTEAQIEEAKKHPVITHTTNFFYIRKRIYEENSDHPMRRQYEKYRALTPWKNDPAMTVTPTFKQKIQKDIWHGNNSWVTRMNKKPMAYRKHVNSLIEMMNRFDEETGYQLHSTVENRIENCKYQADRVEGNITNMIHNRYFKSLPLEKNFLVFVKHY